MLDENTALELKLRDYAIMRGQPDPWTGKTFSSSPSFIGALIGWLVSVMFRLTIGLAWKLLGFVLKFVFKQVPKWVFGRLFKS